MYIKILTLLHLLIKNWLITYKCVDIFFFFFSPELSSFLLLIQICLSYFYFCFSVINVNKESYKTLNYDLNNIINLVIFFKNSLMVDFQSLSKLLPLFWQPRIHVHSQKVKQKRQLKLHILHRLYGKKVYANNCIYAHTEGYRQWFLKVLLIHSFG